MWRVRAVFILLGLWFLGPNAQNIAQATETDSSYLLRLERASHFQSVCILLRGDGQYHLERHEYQAVRIFEGGLDADELRNIFHIVSGNRLFYLEQKQIPDLMLKSDNDQVMLEIHRPGTWQQLFFPDSASRDSFRDAMDPLLKWLETVNKRRMRKLSEEAGRNNCLPPSKPEFAQRGEVRSPQSMTISSLPGNLPPSPPPPPPQTYIVQMTDNRMVNYQILVSCLLVETSGAYHMVKQSKSYNKRLSSMVLDGMLSPPELGTLRTLLDAPDLANQPDENQDPGLVLTGPAADSYLTRLTIPRAGKTQSLSAWKSYRIINHTLSRSVDDHSTKLLAPLREWLKANINEKGAVPTPTPQNARCAPSE
jgi:hypothetical protein